MLYQTANPHGGDIYSKNITLDFSASVNPYGTPPSVLDAIKTALTKICNYPDPGCIVPSTSLIRKMRLRSMYL